MTAGHRSSEFRLSVAFLLVGGAIAWRHGAAAVEAIKGLSYAVSAYSVSRSWLKRKVVALASAKQEKSK